MAELREYHPWLRDRIAAAIQGDNPAYSRRGKIARALVGSNGAGPSFGLADFTPAGVPLNAYDFGRNAANNDKMNALLSGMNIIPGAVLAKGARTLTDAARAAKTAPMAEKIPTSILELTNPTNVLAQPAINNMSRRGFLGGVGAVGAAAMLPGVAGKAVEAVAPKINPQMSNEALSHLWAMKTHQEASGAHMDIVDNFISNNGKIHDMAILKEQQAIAKNKSMQAAEDTSITIPDHTDPTIDQPEHFREDAAERAESTAHFAHDHTDEYAGTEGLDPEYIHNLHDEAATAHSGAAAAHMDEIVKLTGMKPEEILELAEKIHTPARTVSP